MTIGEAAGTDRVSGRLGKEKERVSSWPRAWDFYGGLWFSVRVLSGIQDPVRMKTKVQVSFLSHLFFGARGARH